MEGDNIPALPNAAKQNTSSFSGTKLALGTFWILLIMFVGLISFSYVKGNITNQSNSEKNVLATTNKITYIQDPSPKVLATIENNTSPAAESNTVPSATSNKLCIRTGYAQFITCC